jgi:hypothetical protein
MCAIRCGLHEEENRELAEWGMKEFRFSALAGRRRRQAADYLEEGERQSTGNTHGGALT